MTKWAWSYTVWAVWLLSFLALELSGLFKLTPWETLSSTSWHIEETYPITFKLFGGFLLGLTAHIVMRMAGHGHIALWRAVLFGMIVASAASLLGPEVSL